MTTRDIESYFRQHRRLLAVLLLVVCMTAVSGVFVGMRQTAVQVDAPRPQQAALEVGEHDLPQAPKYAQIRQAGWLANDQWHFSLLNLPQAGSDRDAAPPLTAAERQQVLDDRAQRRAFDGAPPTIPHDINALSAASCTACHGRDVKALIAGKRPPVMSHAAYANCTQCHVPGDGLRRLTEQERLLVDSGFEGQAAPGPGCRAYPGAPPTMPHQVFMREDCMACHGPSRPQAIRSSHAQRQNCLQCHAQDGAVDNRERSSAEPMLRP